MFPCNARRRTSGELDTLDGLAVDSGGRLLEELVALNAQIDHLCSLHGEINEFLGNIVHDFASSLHGNR